MGRTTTLKDNELKAILAEVETEIGQILKSEEQKLAKADDGAGDDTPPKEESSAPPAEASDAPPADASASAASDSATPGAQPGEEQALPPGQDAPEATAAPEGDDPGSAGPMDPEALKGAYAELDDESLKAHYLAAKAALFDRMNGGAGDAASAGAPPPAAAPAPDASASAPPAMPPGPEMGKKEMSEPKANGENPLHVKKSEAESKAEAKVEELEKMVDGLVKAVDLLTQTPLRKAVTAVAHLPKNEGEGNGSKKDVADLSKAEVDAKLKEKVRDPKLSKSDRDLINSYCYGNLKLEKIAHLLQG